MAKNVDERVSTRPRKLKRERLAGSHVSGELEAKATFYLLESYCFDKTGMWVNAASRSLFSVTWIALLTMIGRNWRSPWRDDEYDARNGDEAVHRPPTGPGKHITADLNVS